jgi:uncharacterized iron-regulated membrane protein
MFAEQLEPLTKTTRREAPRPTQAIVSTEGAGSLVQTSRRAWRKFWLTLHLYVGLCAGGLFVLSSLTGSLLVFYKTIDEWLNPDQLLVRPLESFLPLDQIVESAQAAHPEWPALENLTYPRHNRDTFQAWFRFPSAAPSTSHWQVLAIDPYSGRVLSERQWGRYFVSFVYELHKSLLLEETGETIVGLLACVLFLSVGTGIYLWWPAKGQLRRAFSFKTGSSAIRRQYDLHKLSGISAALILLMLAGTGFYLTFPDPVTSTVKLFATIREMPQESEPRSAPASAVQRLPAAEAVAIAQRILPEATVMWIGFPSRPDDVFTVGLRQRGEVREAEGLSQVWIDQYSGTVLRLQDWQAFTTGETFIAWLFPLHNGEAFGLPGRWIVFLTGFAPSVLYLTALRMWWLKRQAHRRQRFTPAFSR